ncbi:hypothetical protein EPN52_01965 [bacterium]|nr:MAG: hypothetical protein EPN52_01965 [bacterium]
MDVGVWRLVNPVGSSVSRLAIGERTPHHGTAKAIGFLSNRKPNTGMLQGVLGKRLEERGFNVRFYEKESAALGASEDLIERIALECGRVINGTGD